MSELHGKKKRMSDVAKPIFVIQKHAARALHYDFRIQVGTILASWAIPKGPSTDPRVKRLAIRTEDHSLNYSQFEGIIPKGEYGGGIVMVWDYGYYRNTKTSDSGRPLSMKASISEGRVELFLEGEKIFGGYALVKTGDKEDKHWLFIKMRDEYADARRNPVNTENRSVLTGKTMEEIARNFSE